MRKQKWLRWISTLAIVILFASFGFSRALRTNAARRYLIARLVASFGRPVDVRYFEFSLLDGARIEAHSVTVSEDPHFGNEYFLRAETLTAGLRWAALFSGRFEFGTLSLQRPSLNLARDAEGHWNIERWLPPAPSGTSRPGFMGPLTSPARAARLYRIDVDGGRINFKQRDDKSPFALLDLSGLVEQDSAGRWQLDIQARPMRAGVELQDIGTLHLRGTIAGTSARLQPADLHLTWRAASLADALRIAREDDYGMRGALDVDLTARVAPPASAPNAVAESGGAQWTISGLARLTGIHGWNLPGHDSDPSANLSLDAAWRVGESRAHVQRLLVEMANSHLQGTGDVDWAHGFRPQVHVALSSVSFSDVLSWYRALRPGVAGDLRADGSVGVDVSLGGWPVQLQQGTIAGISGTLASASFSAPLRIGAVNASVSRGGLDFAPTEISFSPAPSETVKGAGSTGAASPSAFIVRASLFPPGTNIFRWPLGWSFAIQGATPSAQDWLALSGALAQPLNSAWTATGGFAIRMRGEHKADSPATSWLGTMDLRDLFVSPPYVNQPVHVVNTHVEFTPVQRTITLAAVEALGATWRGSVTRKNSDKHWTFDLVADRLDTAELDRWLGPRARPGFLQRITNFGSDASAAPPIGATIDRMEARGRLRAGEIALGPLRFDRLNGDVEISGREIVLRKAQADFFGGNISGQLNARLLSDPSYEFQGRFDRVNLAQLARAVPFLNDRFSGIASATLSLAAHGVGRESLVESMEGAGTLDARNAEIQGLDLTSIFSGYRQDPLSGEFAVVQGDFRIRDREVDLTNFLLEHSRGRLQAEGRIDFSHALSLHIHPSIFQAAASPSSAVSPTFLLNGTIEDPKLALPPPAPAPASRPGSRSR